MTTVGFMSTKMPATFIVDDNVAVQLLEKAGEAGKARSEPASNYVNRLLKWALNNYKEESNALRNDVAEQVPNH